ncbi:hypothetical protein NDU88_007063 [Pleurodeles waltl]|uniref:Uncharacterized protein n=1 Tax=Pleurodeles waltl TaxID=8319 RepID=A0AAV7RTT9_PLEWA|nr:hypothetical protein NDU88_007063 [Pleurodeles waltl]
MVAGRSVAQETDAEEGCWSMEEESVARRQEAGDSAKHLTMLRNDLYDELALPFEDLPGDWLASLMSSEQRIEALSPSLSALEH